MSLRTSIQCDPWSISENELPVENYTHHETLFSLGNGYLGVRGNFEEDNHSAQSYNGAYINGVYWREPIQYPENAFGFATYNDKLINVPSGLNIDICYETEWLQLTKENCRHYERKLDFKKGVLSRHIIWQAKDGSEFEIISRRLVSLSTASLVAIEYEIHNKGKEAKTITLSSSLELPESRYELKTDQIVDPRAGDLAPEQGMQVEEITKSLDIGLIGLTTENAAFSITCAMTHDFITEIDTIHWEKDETSIQLFVDYSLNPDEPLKLIKYVDISHSCQHEYVRNEQSVARLKKAAQKGFEFYLNDQQQILEQFWSKSAVYISEQPAFEQGLHFNLFQLFQSTTRDSRAGVSAKGLSGPGYDGHYFWDSEIYILPFLIFTNPELAKALLLYRYQKLPEARDRARIMANTKAKTKGALFPWRTISGNESSAFFAAGTAQYHINASIAYGVRQYWYATQDHHFLIQFGAELVFETARIWMQVGHFNTRKSGLFCIDNVTGPDEYTAVVNNNFYTNLMAKMHLNFALEIDLFLVHEAPEKREKLLERLELSVEEIELWQKAANKMFLPYDEKLGIYAQDDHFLDKKRWQIDEFTPKPLLLHFHPLTIYRHQVIKQPDVVLAQVLLSEQFSLSQQINNYHYYEAITTHDSTLSPCIYGIAAHRIHEEEAAINYFKRSIRIDLDDEHGNTNYGLHVACLGGSWMSIVYGMAGMSLTKNGLQFKPNCPKSWEKVTFRLQFTGSTFEVTLSPETTQYEWLEGNYVSFHHYDTVIELHDKKTVAKIEAMQEKKAVV